jgi:hypothetical protein
MALNWDASKVEGWKEKAGSVADMVIWMTMFVGINQITEKNYEEFYSRAALLEKLFGASLLKGGEPRPMTLEDIKAYIGLSTNASTLTRIQFNKRQTDRWYRDMDELCRDAKTVASQSK